MFPTCFPVGKRIRMTITLALSSSRRALSLLMSVTGFYLFWLYNVAMRVGARPRGCITVLSRIHFVTGRAEIDPRTALFVGFVKTH
eukprot:3564375-Amphidinium_carterae.1